MYNWQLNLKMAEMLGVEVKVEHNEISSCGYSETTVFIRKHPTMELERFDPAGSIKDLYPYILVHKVGCQHIVPGKEGIAPYWVSRVKSTTEKDVDYLRAQVKALVQHFHDTGYKPPKESYMVFENVRVTIEEGLKRVFKGR